MTDEGKDKFAIRSGKIQRTRLSKDQRKNSDAASGIETPPATGSSEVDRYRVSPRFK